MQIRPDSKSFTVLLGLFAGLPALSIDMSAPAIVLLPAALNTTLTVAGLSLSLFMAGFALGQFVGGRQSDRRGRRPVLLCALALYAVSGAAAALAGSGPALATARLCQGAAAGACSVQASAIVQDLFRGEAARRKQSYVAGIFSVLPMLAPALGTVLIHAWGWRSVHGVLAAAGVFLGLVVLWLMAETKAAPAEGAAAPGSGGMRSVLGCPMFRLTASVNALSYGTLFAYIAASPVVVMSTLGHPASVYAAIFASTALAASAGAWSSAALGRRGLTASQLLQPGLFLLAGGSLAVACIGAGFGARAALIPPLLVMCFARGLVSPNLIHLAMSEHRRQAGQASAMLGLSQLLVGAVAGAVVAVTVPRYGLAGLTVPMFLLSCAATGLWLLAFRNVRRPPVEGSDDSPGVGPAILQVPGPRAMLQCNRGGTS